MRMRLCVIGCVVVSCLVLGGIAQAAVTRRVSVSSAGEQANAYSNGYARVSADGRYVAFPSLASNLVAGDTNGVGDAFVRDQVTGITERVSVSSTGEQANADSGGGPLSADGRYVAFGSSASNLVSGDTNGSYDLFVRDRQAGTTERVSIGSAGEQGNASAGGTGCLSADGRYVAFCSLASNLVAEDTNGVQDAFVHDRQTGATERVSVSSAGEQGNAATWACSLSADGRYAIFYSEADNLVAGDTNGCYDVFVHDRVTGTTERVSVGSAGEQGNGPSWGEACLSADGRYVAFISQATNLVAGDTNGSTDGFVHDRVSGGTERVTVSSGGEQGNEGSGWLSLSGDGRYVVFDSSATNLVTGDTNSSPDVFIHDRVTGATERLSVSTGGEQGSAESGDGIISADGRVVTFFSEAGNLVAGDTNATGDVFVSILNGFVDVFSSYWAYDQITDCVGAGIVSGFADSTYRPAVEVTRDQMAVYMARALCGGDAYVPTAAHTVTFADVPADHWAFKYVEYCFDASIVAGYDDGYRPSAVVDRAQMAVYVARSIVDPTGEDGLAGYTPPTTASFTDVPTDYWAYKHIEYCKAQAIVSGYGDGYRPENAVTRDQMAVYVARAFGLEG
jgi:hypothetical protein